MKYSSLDPVYTDAFLNFGFTLYPTLILMLCTCVEATAVYGQKMREMIEQESQAGGGKGLMNRPRKSADVAK